MPTKRKQLHVRKLREDEVTFELRCEPEEIEIEGNASAISPEEDEKTNKWIRDQLASGNEWAWCTTAVTAKWGEFEATDYLGCCSYLSREDFMQPDGYYDSMKSEALASLNAKIRACAESIAKLVK